MIGNELDRTQGRVSTATVVGGGPAGLIAAEVLARAGVTVAVFEHMPSVGRKLLLAGRGGLNITHSEGAVAFASRYGPSAPRIGAMLDLFGQAELREWCAGLGQPTFVGSSGRVFPEAFRATPLLRAWSARLAELGVRIETRHRWTGWVDDAGTASGRRPLRFEAHDGALVEVDSDTVIFALGGGSWPRVGSDGGWVPVFLASGVRVVPLRAANVGVRVPWGATFAGRFEGVPLKYVAVSVAGSGRPPVRGDAMVTRTGLEGGPVYAVGADIRAALDAVGRCELSIDLRPDLAAERLTDRLARRRPKDSTSNWLRRTIGLDPVAIGLVHELAHGGVSHEPAAVAELVKALPVPVTDTMPIDRAISTAGGVAWTEVDDTLMLRSMPGTFVAGEMIDWEAPTGGYLLQASFSSGVLAANGAIAWLAERSRSPAERRR